MNEVEVVERYEISDDEEDDYDYAGVAADAGLVDPEEEEEQEGRYESLGGDSNGV